ncbi:MAG: hypothetical protein N2253_00550 [Bacteroidia bacterium]|nr:hypothetical protein [Bacteroidia bacterium]
MWRLLTLIGGLGVAFLALTGNRYLEPVQVESSSYFPWEPVGPYNVGHVLTRGIRLGNKVFVGSAFGGLYESQDGGRSWRPVPGFTLNQNGEAVYRALSVTALAASGSVLYVGTGNVPAFNPAGVSFRVIDTLRGNILGGFGMPGMGVFVSRDGGVTFSNQNPTWSLSYPAVSYSPNYARGIVTNVIDIAVQNDKVAILTPDSLLISTDALQTVERRAIPAGRVPSSVAWGADGVLFLGTRDSLYRSEDNGQTFTAYRGTALALPSEVTQPATASQYGRAGYGGAAIVVRSAPSDPRIIYAIGVGGTGRLLSVWVSSDNGATWNSLSSAQNSSFDVLDVNNPGIVAFRIDPQDPAHILLGGAQIWEFTPQKGWQRLNPVNIDGVVLAMPRPIRDFVFLDNEAFLVIGTGKLLRIVDNGTRAEDVTRGIQASAILSLAVAPNGDLYASGPSPVNIVANFTESDPPMVFRLLNLGNPFTPVSAPSGYVAVSTRLPSYVFFSYQGGRLRLSTDRGQQFSSIYNPPARYAFYRLSTQDSIQPPTVRSAITEDRPANSGPIYPPFVLMESFPELVLDRNRRLAGTSHLFVATSGHLWYVSNSITNIVDSLQYWSRVSPTSISNVSAATFSDYYNSTRSIPTAIAAVHEGNGDYTVWIGNSNGVLRRIRKAQDITLDRSSNFNFEDMTSAIASLVDGRTISAIAIHPNNPNLLAIAVSSYRGPTDRIFLTRNATDPSPTFTSIHANLPNVPVYSLFFHPDSSGLLLAGTQWGLWRCSDVTNPIWEEITGEAIGRVPVTAITWKPYRYQIDTVDKTDPAAPLWEARVLPDPERPIYIATWGRGIWKISSRFATALPTASSAQPLRLEVFPNPFSEEIRIKLSTAVGASRVSWQLYNLAGQKLGSYTYSDRLLAGEHTFSWRIGSLPHGIYFLEVEVIDGDGKRYIETRKLLHQ